MDGDNVFVQFLARIWSVRRLPQNWQALVRQALVERSTAITDPSHWIKVFRYDKLKPGCLHLVGPIQAAFASTARSFGTWVFREAPF
jgi:hypothetical protein